MVYKVRDLMFDTSTWDDDGSNFVGLTGIIFDGCIEGPNGFFSVEVEKFLDEELKEIYDELDEEKEIENLRKQIEVIKKDIAFCEKALDTLREIIIYKKVSDTLQNTFYFRRYKKFRQAKIQLVHDLELLTNELTLLEKHSRHCKKQCSYSNHCMCPFECTSFMLYDGCEEQQSDNLGWSIQAKRDEIL